MYGLFIVCGVPGLGPCLYGGGGGVTAPGPLPVCGVGVCGCVFLFFRMLVAD